MSAYRVMLLPLIRHPLHQRLLLSQAPSPIRLRLLKRLQRGKLRPIIQLVAR